MVQMIDLCKPLEESKLGIITTWSKHHGGVVVIEIESGGYAHRDGRLQLGDYIIRANGENLAKLRGSEAQAAFTNGRKTNTKISLVVARPNPNDVRVLPSNILGDEEELKKYL